MDPNEEINYEGQELTTLQAASHLNGLIRQNKEQLQEKYLDEAFQAYQNITQELYRKGRGRRDEDFIAQEIENLLEADSQVKNLRLLTAEELKFESESYADKTVSSEEMKERMDPVQMAERVKQNYGMMTSEEDFKQRKIEETEEFLDIYKNGNELQASILKAQVQQKFL